jgi:uncharacterized protein (UPF0333 family)
MLEYGIGALLIVLIITITLSYHYNKEGFAALTAAAQPAAPAAAPAAPAVAETISESISVDAPDPLKQNYVADHKRSVQDTKPASSANEPTNTERNIKMDKIVINTETDNKFLYVFASAQLLPSGTAMKYWIITDNPNDPNNPVIPLWKQVVVSNDLKFKSASIPTNRYAPYAGQTAYLVPRGSLNSDDAVGTFIIPSPSKPTVVNPRIELSDTGYTAMKMNKHSNLLNDIQKIIHNEMLSNRSLDIVVKNVNPPGGSMQRNKSIDALAKQDPLQQAIAQQAMSKKGASYNGSSNGSSCGGSCGGTCDTCSSSRDENAPDMSKYIRKDQIPCWGCSLDY